jgi:hypothetical protein
MFNANPTVGKQLIGLLLLSGKFAAFGLFGRSESQDALKAKANKAQILKQMTALW